MVEYSKAVEIKCIERDNETLAIETKSTSYGQPTNRQIGSKAPTSGGNIAKKVLARTGSSSEARVAIPHAHIRGEETSIIIFIPSKIAKLCSPFAQNLRK